MDRRKRRKKRKLVRRAGRKEGRREERRKGQKGGRTEGMKEAWKDGLMDPSSIQRSLFPPFLGQRTPPTSLQTSPVLPSRPLVRHLRTSSQRQGVVSVEQPNLHLNLFTSISKTLCLHSPLKGFFTPRLLSCTPQTMSAGRNPCLNHDDEDDDDARHSHKYNNNAGVFRFIRGKKKRSPLKKSQWRKGQDKRFKRGSCYFI